MLTRPSTSSSVVSTMSASFKFACKSVLSSSQCLTQAARYQSLVRCSRGLATTTHDIYSPHMPPPRFQVPAYTTRTDPHSVAALVRNIRHYLGSKRGIQGTDDEVAHLKGLMARCRPGVEEWKQYGRPDPKRTYTRLLVDDVNGKCNLVSILVCERNERPPDMKPSYSSSGTPQPNHRSTTTQMLCAS